MINDYELYPSDWNSTTVPRTISKKKKNNPFTVRGAEKEQKTESAVSRSGCLLILYEQSFYTEHY